MRLICARVEPIIDPLLPQEQAGFRKSTVDPVTLLTQDAENSCSAKKKAGAVFVDLTGAYNTVIACELLRLLPDRHMFRMTMELVGNRSFTLPPATTNGAGYDTSRTASHRDSSWQPFSSTSTSLTCQTPSQESMHTLTT